MDKAGGYPKLARVMGVYPEMAIYRRFGYLNSLNLLYYQAELSELELKLERYQRADRASHDRFRSEYFRDWQEMAESAETPGGSVEQLKTVLKMRTLLREFSM